MLGLMMEEPNKKTSRNSEKSDVPTELYKGTRQEYFKEFHTVIAPLIVLDKDK